MENYFVNMNNNRITVITNRDVDSLKRSKDSTSSLPSIEFSLFCQAAPHTFLYKTFLTNFLGLVNRESFNYKTAFFGLSL